MATTPSSKEHAASAILSRAHSPSTTTDIFRDKVQKRPLLLRPSSPDPKDTARHVRRKARQQKAALSRRSKKPKPLSASQKRSLQIYDIPKDQRKYAIYEPMHRMWLQYIREILGINGERKTIHVTASGAGPMLTSADFHGAAVEVVRSRCVGRVGLKGIVLKDTKYTFEIITRKNELKVVPKEHTIFSFEIPFDHEARDNDMTDDEKRKPLVFELHGSQFETRAPDRANKKFKMHIDPDI